ncbi:MAG: DUF3810 domain-containing protein [Clostridia bacterium]|nr:DUF3810 domain-containing protein [Clostridia bacterium]
MNTKAKTTTFQKIRRYIPVCLPVCLVLAAASLFITLYTADKPELAAQINYWWGGILRFGMAYLSVLIPFSLAEGLLIFSPVLLAFLIYLAVRFAQKGLRAGIRYLCVLLSILCLIYTFFVASLGLGFNVPTLGDELGLADEPVSAEQLYETMMWAADEANALCGKVDFAFQDFSYMPFANYNDMCADLMVGYARLHREHPLYFNLPTRIKPVILSEAMSYTHITGIYTFFTGESNLNVNFPDYTLPFTAAHELAHQRGFAREKEANFIAFLVCIRSEDPYTRYSGYVNMVEYLSNALYSADRDLWNECMNHLDNRIRYEMRAYSAFFEKYRENTAAKVSDAVNDTYLKSQGQEAGTKSYGLVVDLAVSYYYQNVKPAETLPGGEEELTEPAEAPDGGETP